MFWVLDGWWVVLSHLDGNVAGDIRGAAPTVPHLRVQELARVVRTVAQSWAVEGWMRAVHFLLSIAFGEEVDRHHACTLQKSDAERKMEIKTCNYELSPGIPMGNVPPMLLTPEGIVYIAKNHGMLDSVELCLALKKEGQYIAEFPAGARGFRT